MGETLYRFATSELTTVRIRCKCGTTVEMPTAELPRHGDLKCPACGQLFQSRDHAAKIFGDLAACFQVFSNHSHEYTVEFAITPPASK